MLQLHYIIDYRLNNLEVEEEEVNVSDSPNTGQRPDTSNDKKRSWYAFKLWHNLKFYFCFVKKETCNKFLILVISLTKN